MTPARLAVQAAIRLRRNRPEPVKMLAARCRPVQAHRRCVQGHVLVGADGRSPLLLRKRWTPPTYHVQSSPARRHRKQAT